MDLEPSLVQVLDQLTQPTPGFSQAYSLQVITVVQVEGQIGQALHLLNQKTQIDA